MKLTLPCIYVGSLQVVFSINDNNKNQLQRVVTFAVQNTQAEIAAKSIHIADLWILPIFVQTLGLSHALTSFMWLCGPIAGLVVSTILFLHRCYFFSYCGNYPLILLLTAFQVQPLVGLYSDKCTTRWGRRRPFILTGCLLICLAVRTSHALSLMSNPFRYFLRTELKLTLCCSSLEVPY